MEDEIAAGEDVGDAEEELPENAALGVGLEGHDEVGDSAEEHASSR